MEKSFFIIYYFCIQRRVIAFLLSCISTSTPRVEFGCFEEVTFAMSSSNFSCPVPAFERMIIIRDEAEPASDDLTGYCLHVAELLSAKPNFISHQTALCSLRSGTVW